MTIKSKLIIVGLIPLFLALVTAVSIYWTNEETTKSRAKLRTIQEITGNVFEMNLAVDQYLRLPEERPRVQFQTVFNSLKITLAMVKPETEQERSLINIMKESHQSMGELFSMLVSLQAKEPSGSGENDLPELRERIISQLLADSRDIVSHAQEFSSISAARLNALLDQGLAFMLLTILVSALGLVVFAYWIGRSILKPLLLLRKGTDTIANGDLNFRITTVGRDEIGQLSTAFNEMAQKLTGSYVTLQALQEEIAERQKAEASQRQSEARYRLLSETASRLLATDNPQGMVNELCRQVMAYLDCQTFFNFLVDEAAGRLHLNAYAGIPEEEARKIEWLDYGVAVCGCVARDRTRIIAEDILHTPDIRTDLIKSFGVQAYCCHPLMPQGRLIGTLSFGTRTRPSFTPEEVDLMRTVTDQVATAMERILTQEDLRRQAQELQSLTQTLEERVRERTMELANLSKELVTSQENERKRVSYDLHDKVWQILVAIRFDIERLFSGQGKGDWAALEKKSKTIMADLLEAVGKIRSMQGDLWPYVLDDIGIIATIDWYCREFEKTHPALTIEKRVDLTENAIPVATKIIIYRILQEALSNTGQHSRADHIKALSQ